MFHVLLKETAGLQRNANILQFGVPLPKGRFFNHRKLIIVTDEGVTLPSNISTTALWPDNSIKWCLVKTRVELDQNEALPLSIIEQSGTYDSNRRMKEPVTDTGSEIQIQTRNCLFTLDKKKFQFLQKVSRHGKCIADNGFCTLKIDQYGQLDPEITGYQHHTSYASACPISCEIIIAGQFQTPSGESIANFDAKLTFFIETDLLKCDFTLHNPRAARHASGLWDLGDPNSLIFKSLELGLTLNDITEINWKTGRNEPWKTLMHQPLTVYQESSGGQNWNSPNHKDRNNRFPYTLNGYVCTSRSGILESGKRTSPGLRITSNSGQVGIFIENFWQNFPKSLGMKENRINIGLFPGQFSGEFEIQPGEKKAHTIYFDFSGNTEAVEHIENPVEVTLNPAWIEKSGVFSHFHTDTLNDGLQQVINEGLVGDNNFFVKREAIDEYGWRNFGDLFADHETDGYKGTEIFISHYNNQYDPIYGFLHQYALTADHRWLELADDLAKHVTDIDIYHTNNDRDEYNGGLFWHTDHYLEAGTSTHRSFSKYQESGAYIDHAGGGGPGGQHCYTTGLLYHYLLTGNASSKQAVFQLTDWVTNIYEGSGSLLAVLYLIKNRKGTGSKNILSGKYPLDRGTGNYINALLDEFTLTQERNTLYQAGHVIRNTIHPMDNITARNLGDVEINWFYTVFLQSVCRYLQTKEELSELDDAFYYARDSLLHYADWMVENEYPYLEQPEILEFPNHTWTAQDIRKVNILLFASYYSPEPSCIYSSKASELYSYITKNMVTEKTRTYTRILAILMQNHGAISYFNNLDKVSAFKAVKDYPPTKDNNRFQSFMNLIVVLARAMARFSPKQELLWLSHRSDRIAKLFSILQ